LKQAYTKEQIGRYVHGNRDYPDSTDYVRTHKAENEIATEKIQEYPNQKPKLRLRL
jgi:hypothetical protein